jgi:hypothetical protein
MKIKVNMSKSLLESLTKEVILEAKAKKDNHKKEDKKEDKKDLKESEALNETPMMDFLNAVKDLDPAAVSALLMSGLPIAAAIKMVVDTVKKDPKDPSKSLLDRLKGMGKRAQQNR